VSTRYIGDKLKVFFIVDAAPGVNLEVERGVLRPIFEEAVMELREEIFGERENLDEFPDVVMQISRERQLVERSAVNARESAKRAEQAQQQTQSMRDETIRWKGVVERLVEDVQALLKRKGR
jgi:hypothetical protein